MIEYRQIVSWVTKLEGKKKSVGVGQVREVLKCLKKVYQRGPNESVAIVQYLDRPDRRGRPQGALGKKKKVKRKRAKK